MGEKCMKKFINFTLYLSNGESFDANAPKPMTLDEYQASCNEGGPFNNMIFNEDTLIPWQAVAMIKGKS